MIATHNGFGTNSQNPKEMPIHESKAHDQAGKQFGRAQGVGLHVFPKIMLYIMVSNSKKT